MVMTGLLVDDARVKGLTGKRRRNAHALPRVWIHCTWSYEHNTNELPTFERGIMLSSSFEISLEATTSWRLQLRTVLRSSANM